MAIPNVDRHPKGEKWQAARNAARSEENKRWKWNWLVVLTILKNMKVNGKDDIPYMKWKIKAMIQTTRKKTGWQFFGSPPLNYKLPQCRSCSEWTKDLIFSHGYLNAQKILTCGLLCNSDKACAVTQRSPKLLGPGLPPLGDEWAITTSFLAINCHYHYPHVSWLKPINHCESIMNKS
jgi:hypothetical protein